MYRITSVSVLLTKLFSFHTIKHKKVKHHCSITKVSYYTNQVLKAWEMI